MKGTLYTDGASKGNPGPSSIGIVLYDEYGKPIVKHGAKIQATTAPVAEYMALREGLGLAHKHGITDITCLADSKVMVDHINGDANVRNWALLNIMGDIRKHADGFENIHVAHIRRHYNQEADEMANHVFRGKKNAEHTMASI